MYAVRAAEAGDTAHSQVPAVIGLVQEIAAVARGVAFEEHVFAAAYKYGVRAAVVLFAVGVIAVHAVDNRTGLAYDGDIFLTVSR